MENLRRVLVDIGKQGQPSKYLAGLEIAIKDAVRSTHDINGYLCNFNDVRNYLRTRANLK